MKTIKKVVNVETITSLVAYFCTLVAQGDESVQTIVDGYNKSVGKFAHEQAMYSPVEKSMPKARSIKKQPKPAYVPHTSTNIESLLKTLNVSLGDYQKMRKEERKEFRAKNNIAWDVSKSIFYFVK